jgi:hypothetical protein
VGSAARYFPLRAEGFSGNPFRALTDAAWADVAVLAPAVLHDFDLSADHLQVLGPLGAGKTTHLFGLKRRAEGHGLQAAYAYLAEGHDKVPDVAGDLGPLDLLLLDEAQRLEDRAWVALLTQIAGRAAGRPLRLVLSAHGDQSARFAAAGLPLATVRLGEMSVPEYRAILDRRIEAAALPGRPHATLTDDAAAFLLKTFGPNRRAAEWLLYEAFQQVRTPAAVDAAQLRAVQAQTTVTMPPGVSGCE